MYELAKELHGKITALIAENERLRVMNGRLQAELTETRISLDEQIAVNQQLSERLPQESTE